MNMQREIVRRSFQLNGILSFLMLLKFSFGTVLTLSHLKISNFKFSNSSPIHRIQAQTIFEWDFHWIRIVMCVGI